MASKFEDALFRTSGEDDEFHSRMAEKLDSQSLRHLRAVSNTLKSFADKHGDIAFSELFIHAPVRSERTAQGVEYVAAFCRVLTIIVGPPKEPEPEPTPSEVSTLSPSKKEKRRSKALRRLDIVKKIWSSSVDLLLPPMPSEQPSTEVQTQPSLQHPDAVEMDFNVWQYLLAQFPNMQTLILRVPSGDPAWPGRQLIEQTLIMLRICLERSRPRKLHTIVLSPIHAMGILHLRWSGFGAFYEVPSPKLARMWTNLTTLDLSIVNPITLIDDMKMRMFFGTLYDYLRSFSRSLQCLKFVWLGDRAGPSPLCLEDEHGLLHRSPIRWPKLESFWFGNITYPNKTTSLLPECAPRCSSIKTLRGTHRVSRVDGKANVNEEESWYDVPIERLWARRNRASLAASSIYSQRGDDDMEENGGVSRTSRIVPFMFDGRSLGETLPARTYGR